MRFGADNSLLSVLVHYRIFSSTSGLYPQDASSIPPVVTTKKHFQMPSWEQKSPEVGYYWFEIPQFVYSLHCQCVPVGYFFSQILYHSGELSEIFSWYASCKSFSEEWNCLLVRHIIIDLHLKNVKYFSKMPVLNCPSTCFVKRAFDSQFLQLSSCQI